MIAGKQDGDDNEYVTISDWLCSVEGLSNKQVAFLTAYHTCFTIKEAAEAAKISAVTAYTWNKRVKEGANYPWVKPFSEAMQICEEIKRDRLREAAFHRAVEGVKKYVTNVKGLIYDKEGRPLVEYKFSDQLLIKFLVCHCPEFREIAKEEAQAKKPVVNFQMPRNGRESIPSEN